MGGKDSPMGVVLELGRGSVYHAENLCFVRRQGRELGDRLWADGKDSPLRGGGHARIKLHVADQEAAKKAESWYVRARSG